MTSPFESPAQWLRNAKARLADDYANLEPRKRGFKTRVAESIVLKFVLRAVDNAAQYKTLDDALETAWQHSVDEMSEYSLADSGSPSLAAAKALYKKLGDEARAAATGT